MTKDTEATKLSDADLDQVTGGLKMADKKDTGQGFASAEDLGVKGNKQISTMDLGSGRTETDESKTSTQRTIASGGSAGI